MMYTIAIYCSILQYAGREDDCDLLSIARRSTEEKTKKKRLRKKKRMKSNHLPQEDVYESLF